MKRKGLITLSSLDDGDVRGLVERACHFGLAPAAEPTLSRKRVGLLFERPSTRTRTAFALAAQQLGAWTISYGPADLQTSTGETLRDTGQLLAQFLDCLVVRTHHNWALEQLNLHIPVINALTEEEHPTQAIADIATMVQERGSMDGLHIAFLGEGGNIAKALCLAASRYPGVRLSVVSPRGFGLSDDFLQLLCRLCRASGAAVEQLYDDVNEVARPIDVVYTTRWMSMGQEKAPEGWRELFRPLAVTPALMAALGHPATIFLHDLPAERGAEVADKVLDGPWSRVLVQARNKLYGAMAVLEWVLAQP